MNFSLSFFAKYSIKELFLFKFNDSKIGSFILLALIPLISTNCIIGFSITLIYKIPFLISNFTSLKKLVLYKFFIMMFKSLSFKSLSVSISPNNIIVSLEILLFPLTSYFLIFSDKAEVIIKKKIVNVIKKVLNIVLSYT